MDENKIIPEMRITIKNKRATYDKLDGNIVCGNPYTAVFNFDAEWKTYDVKKARFTYWHKGKYESIDVEFTGNICPIPPLYNVKFVKIGVYVEGGISTTTPAIIDCDASILCGESANVLESEEIDNINEALIVWMKQHPPKDGFSPTVTVTKITNGHRVTITDIEGDKSFDVMHGTGGGGSGGEISRETVVEILEEYLVSVESHTLQEAKDYTDEAILKYHEEHPVRDGEDGEDGFSPTIKSAETFDGGYLITITDVNGVSNVKLNHGKNGAKGDNGYTPVRGTDYWTDDDISEIKSYVDDAILGGEW